MRTFHFTRLSVLAGATTLLAAPAMLAGQGGSVKPTDEVGLRNFVLAVGEVYGVPGSRVASFAPDRIVPEELPVAFLIAREARVEPDTVVALRVEGGSWSEIAQALDVRPGIFLSHLPLMERGFLPDASGRWPTGTVVHEPMTDRELIDLANVQLWAAYYRRPVDEVIRIRGEQDGWVEFAAAARSAPRALDGRPFGSDDRSRARPSLRDGDS